MASQDEQLSHKQKLENARNTRGHRRTQSNSQYDFSQLKVTPQLTEEQKKNKEDFNLMITVNRIIDANSTQQALEAQKYNLNEKKTIVDCIDEDIQSSSDGAGQTSAGYSMFNFGKNLHKKRRHNSDFSALSQNTSNLFSSNDRQQKLNEKNCNQFGSKKINNNDEDEDEEGDDFDSMFQQKFKKFGSQSGAGVYNNGLYSIPELANSSEFGTSIYKDNQSVHSHSKILANNSKILNSSNSPSLDFTQEQIHQSKVVSSVSQQNQQTNTSIQQQSQLHVQNQQQSQQNSQSQKILNQQFLEYENAKQNYQNQLKKQFQQSQNNQINFSANNDIQKLDEKTSTIPKSYIGQVFSHQLNQDSKQKDISTKVNTQVQSEVKEELNKQNEQTKIVNQKQSNQQNQNFLKNNENNKNLSFATLNSLPSQQRIHTQINIPLTQVVSPVTQMISPHSELATQKNNGTLPSQIQTSQNNTNPNLNSNQMAAQSSLMSSSNISSYHHSRVESSSSQFGVQSYANDQKDTSSISRVTKRNSIHEIFNSGTSNQLKPSNLNSQTFQFQCLSKQFYQDKSQLSNSQVECESDRISNISDINKPILEEGGKQYNWLNKNSNKTEESIQQSCTINNNSQSIFAPKVNLMLSKSSLDRKGISKQRYSQCQNEQDESTSLVENNLTSKECKNHETTVHQNILKHNQLPSTCFKTNSISHQQIDEIQLIKGNFFQPQNVNFGTIPNQQSSQTQENQTQLNFSNQIISQGNKNSHRGPVGDNLQPSFALPIHQSAQSFSQPKSSSNISDYSHTSTLKKSVLNQQYQNQQQSQIITKNSQNQQQNHKSNYSTSNISLNNNKNSTQQNEQHQRNISMNINISHLLNSNHSLSSNLQSSNNFQNSNTSSNSKSNKNLMSSNHLQSNSSQQTTQQNIQQNRQQNSLLKYQIQQGVVQQQMNDQQKQQLQLQSQLESFQQQKSESSIIESDQQLKTYSQIIKQFLQKNNNNQSRLNSNNTLSNSETISKNSSNQNTLKKSSVNLSKESKQKNIGSTSTNPINTKTNQGNSLEGRVFMLESKILSLRQKTDNLEQQNLNLTQELFLKNNEKDHIIRENIENKKRINELENITKRNEDNIQIIFQMLQKSQSDYELLKSQKQEVSTNIFTDISCIDSPHEIYNHKGQKQTILQQKEHHQTEYGDQRYEGNSSYLSKDKEQKFKSSFNNNNIDNYSNFSKSNYGQQVQQQPQYIANQQHNENSSFNSLLQEKKQQQNMQAKNLQNQQYQYNGQLYNNINNILKPSNLNHQNQARFQVYN